MTIHQLSIFIENRSGTLIKVLEVLKEAKGYYYLITFHSDGTYSGKAYGNEMVGTYEGITGGQARCEV